MKTKVVWEQDIDCNGIIYHTSITKPMDYGEKWQIALHVKVNGKSLHDYNTHFIEGAGAWDGEVVNEQIMFMYGRLMKNFPNLEDSNTIWYRKMTREFFKFEDFDFEV